MSMIKIKLDNGFEFEVIEEIIISWKFTRLMGEVDNEPTPANVTNFFKLVLNDRLYEFEDYLEEHLGRTVLITDMMSAIKEIVAKLRENPDVKKL